MQELRGSFTENLLFETFRNKMLDQGHVAWRNDYQSGLAKQQKALTTPRPKPLPPKADETKAILSHVQSLSPQAQAQYLAERGMTLTEKDGVFTLSQDINTEPGNLTRALHMKLNGIHFKYASVVAAFVQAVENAGRIINRDDVIKLSTAIHDLWMPENSWQVQGLFAKAGISESAFYSLSLAQIVETAERLRSSAEKELFAPAELEQLAMFTAYANLTERVQLIDDKILLEHSRVLAQMILAQLP
jgi:hypothetical protein